MESKQKLTIDFSVDFDGAIAEDGEQLRAILIDLAVKMWLISQKRFDALLAYSHGTKVLRQSLEQRAQEAGAYRLEDEEE